ncbi:MAG: D-isomer specific 2-hydroxyacid dehydrogenase family protein [Acidimicrobiales bacterium]
MTAVDRRLIAVAPDSRPAMYRDLRRAVAAAGGEVVDIADASALVWADPGAAARFPQVLAEGPSVEWVQLPYAGVESFAPNLDDEHVWTCGKGVYADPVAEHVITLALAGFRFLHTSIPARSWPPQQGRNLLGASVTVIGSGGITESLLRLLEPWGTRTTVVRRRDEEMEGAAHTCTLEHVLDAVSTTDLVVLAAALTDETRGMVDRGFLDAMDANAWLINVARGGLVVTDDLVDALRADRIAGAALDVTEPEPLPDGHPLWDLANCIITPHVGNTPEMGLPLLAGRVRKNVERWIAGDELIGLVDVRLGY